MSSLTLHNVTIGYDRKVVASGIDATMQTGRLICLIGMNGSGKSTLMRTMAAFQQPLTGTIMLQSATAEGGAAEAAEEAQSVASMSPAERARLIGVVLTHHMDLQNMSVREMVNMGRMPYTGFWGSLSHDDADIVQRAIEQVAITNLADRQMQTLSDGERQKVMIAKAIAQQTPFIFLDEPTAFLDYPSKVDTMLLLQQLCHDAAEEERKSILISTHDLDVALKYCDEIWMMKDGHLLIGNRESLNAEIAQFMRLQ